MTTYLLPGDCRASTSPSTDARSWWRRSGTLLWQCVIGGALATSVHAGGMATSGASQSTGIGMQATVMVKTGERSLLVYMMRPLLRRFESALSER